MPVLGEEIPAGLNLAARAQYDGYRMQAQIEGGTVRMLSKNGLEIRGSKQCGTGGKHRAK